MKIRKVIIIAISLLFVIIMICLLKEDVWDKNATLLKKRILTIDKTVESVDLSNVTPFKWDTIYTFAPYTPKDKIYETVGYKWENISETVSEGMNQIVFLKDGKVVCYLYGYPSNNGYGISFFGKTYKNGASVLTIEDNLNFQVTRNDGVIFLEQVK